MNFTKTTKTIFTHSITPFVFVFLVLAVSLFYSHTTFADGFNPGRIIDDSVFTNSNSIGITQIQQFLNSKVPTCDTNGTQSASDWGYPNLTHAQFATQVKGWPGPPYTCLKDYTENGLGSAQIIYNAAQQYQINPEVLIVLLQKESGLVTDTWPLPGEYKTATGYACPDSGTCDSQYYGLTNQINNAAYMYHAIMTHNPNWYSPYILGNNYIQYNPNASCGGSTVNIQNMATVALYDYTPYQPNAAALAAPMGTTVNCGAYGNLNFYRYFTSWFGTAVIPTSTAYISNGIYSLQNVNSSTYLNVAGASPTPGTKVQIYHNDGTNAMNWLITRDSDGYYTLQNVATGNYLDVTGGNFAPGTPMQTWTGNGTCSQKWAAIYQGGYYEFLNQCSGLALDVTRGGTNDGTPVQLWSNNQTPAQNWNLTANTAAPLNTGFYSLTTGAGPALDTANSQTIDGTPVQIATASSSQSQIWQFVRRQDGTYTIRNVLSGKYLDIANESVALGTATQILSKDGNCAQRWTITANGNSTYTITSVCTGLALDVTGGAIATPGTVVQMWTANGTGSQQWSLNQTQGIPAGTYSLQSPSGLALDITGGNLTIGTKTQLWYTNGTSSQSWLAAQQNDGTYTLQNPVSGNYLDLTGGVSAPGTRIQIWSGNGTCSQRWNITKNSNATYTIQSACTGLALDIARGAVSTLGTPVQVWTANGTGSQQWVFGNP